MMQQEDLATMLFRLGYIHGVLTRSDARAFWIEHGIEIADYEKLQELLMKFHVACYNGPGEMEE